ncbi:hypothetical protein [Mycetocola zhujimingii]|uniref:Uncharacterized protein n=1 Tax=Mycetocola zhujimingii TaxID=2079792 RepID=A0A2U1TC43_9MICO|nr:hypothetical protein [Mycetocola zhujimingii]PWC06461.1 hypothetical protein DF223_12800 [Mycetocola zhujimingii]
MEKPLPTMDDVLLAYFGTEYDNSTGVQRKRIVRVDKLLRRYLESEPETFLGPYGRAILDAEREFAPKGAVCRIMRADTLLFALQRFIEPPHLDPDPLVQRVQLRCVERLIARLVRIELAEYDTTCVQWDLNGALRRAKSELNRDRREAARARRRAQRDAELRASDEQYPGVFGVGRSPWGQPPSP